MKNPFIFQRELNSCRTVQCTLPTKPFHSVTLYQSSNKLIRTYQKLSSLRLQQFYRLTNFIKCLTSFRFRANYTT